MKKSQKKNEIKLNVIILDCSMQVTEEVSSSMEVTRTTTVQETRTIVEGDGTETTTVTSHVTESSQQVNSSGDAPATGEK